MLTIARQMTRTGKARVRVGSQVSVETGINCFRTPRANRVRGKPSITPTSARLGR